MLHVDSPTPWSILTTTGAIMNAATQLFYFVLPNSNAA